MMHKLNFQKLFLFCSIVSGSLWAQDKDYSSVVIKSTKVTESIYMLEGDGGNIGVCIGNDGTFIIDDQYAPLTEKIKAAIAKLTDQPVSFVMNTHFHGDHVGGNENFGKEGALIVSHENVRKRLASNQPSTISKESKEIGLPKITFSTGMTFHYNGETIEIFHVENAHTDGDAMIFFKDSNVIHMGDVFVRYGFPFIDESKGGNINGMILTIDAVLELIDKNTKIIPGHGDLSSKQDMINFNNMLRTVRDRVQKLMEEGKSIEDIEKSDPLRDYEKKGVNTYDFIKVVYASVLKTKKI